MVPGRKETLPAAGEDDAEWQHQRRQVIQTTRALSQTGVSKPVRNDMYRASELMPERISCIFTALKDSRMRWS